MILTFEEKKLLNTFEATSLFVDSANLLGE